LIPPYDPDTAVILCSSRLGAYIHIGWAPIPSNPFHSIPASIVVIVPIPFHFPKKTFFLRPRHQTSRESVLAVTNILPWQFCAGECFVRCVNASTTNRTDRATTPGTYHPAPGHNSGSMLATGEWAGSITREGRRHFLPVCALRRDDPSHAGRKVFFLLLLTSL